MRDRWLVAISFVALAGCVEWELCDSAELDFELPGPRDEVTVLVRTCVEGDEGDARISMDLNQSVAIDAAIAISVDGVDASPAVDGASWGSDEGFYEPVEGPDCALGQRIVLQRFDDDWSGTFTGSIAVDMIAPPETRCTATVELEPR